MMDAIFPFFEWCEASWLGSSIRASLWLFPVIEAFHLVAFAVLGGTVLMSDLRLLGVAMKDQSVTTLDKNLRPWFNGALIFTATSGVLLFLSESVKCFYSQPFRIKIIALTLAILYTVTLRRKVVLADSGRFPASVLKVVAIVSITLWATVAWGGRWIGFSG